jgi:hypothetical protein
VSAEQFSGGRGGGGGGIIPEVSGLCLQKEKARIMKARTEHMKALLIISNGLKMLN